MSSTEDIRTALDSDDLVFVETLLRDKQSVGQLNLGWFGLAGPPLVIAQSTAMVDTLLQYGADVARVSEWWGSGRELGDVSLEVAAYLLRRGATVTACAAAGLGLTAELGTLLEQDPECVHSKGCDGARPIHFARNVETAQLLMAHGAAVDVRDDDHHSTPTQWQVRDRPDVVATLLEAGAELDIFVAVGLGDILLVQQAVANTPECTGFRIGGMLGDYPGIGYKGKGGTILQWTLAFNVSPQEIALQRGHQDIWDYLMDRTSVKPKLLIACMVGDENLARSILSTNPELIRQFDDDDSSLLARACWETNRNYEAVRIMLDLGFPVDIPEMNHGYTPLHNAAWDGNTDLVKLLIERGHPVNVPDPNYDSTPFGFCVHAAVEARRASRDYAGVIDRLIQAGAEFDSEIFPTGHRAIDEVLERWV